MQLQKINDIKIKGIKPLDEEDKRLPLGHELCKLKNGSVGLFGATSSGKTSVIFEFLKRCVSKKKTKIMLFVRTIHHDVSWLAIQKYLKEKGYDFEVHESLLDERGNNILVNWADNLVAEAKLKAHDTKEPTSRKQSNIRTIQTVEKEHEDQEKKRPERKSKFWAPSFLIVVDDLSDQLKASSFTTLLKHLRHLNAKMLISTQYIKDLPPAGHSQLMVRILFGGLKEANLQHIYDASNTAMPIPFDDFKKMYEEATIGKYNFLYMHPGEKDFRKNVDMAFPVN